MNSSNYTDYSSYEELFIYGIGSDRTLDSLYMFSTTLIGGMGLILNMLSFALFLNQEFEIPLYSYLRVCIINSAVACLIIGSTFTVYALSYFSWTYSYSAQLVNAYITIPIINTTYYYGTVLDIIITLDRISHFCKPVKKLFFLTPYKMCAAALAFVIITDFPYYFMYSMTSATFSVHFTRIVTVWFNVPSAFGFTTAGFVLTIIMQLFRDLFLLLVELVLNAVSLYCLRMHFKKRSELISIPSRKSNNIELEEVKSRKPSTSQRPSNITRKSTATAAQANATSSADLRATVMAVVMCTLSIVEHVSAISCILTPYFGASYLTIDYVCFGTNFSIGFKNAANFFIFFFFNKKFAEKLNAMFKINRN